MGNCEKSGQSGDQDDIIEKTFNTGTSILAISRESAVSVRSSTAEIN